MKRRGHSVIEVTIASAVLMILMALTYALLVLGLKVFEKSDIQSDLLGSLQILGSRWVRDVMSSHVDGTAWELDRCSLMTPWGDVPAQAVGVHADLLWQAHQVYYRDASGVLALRTIKLAAPRTAVKTLPLEDFGTGPHPIAYYAAAGQKLCEGVSSLRFSQTGPVLQMDVSASRYNARSGKQDALQLSFAARLRNSQ